MLPTTKKRQQLSPPEQHLHNLHEVLKDFYDQNEFDVLVYHLTRSFALAVHDEPEFAHDGAFDQCTVLSFLTKLNSKWNAYDRYVLSAKRKEGSNE